MKYKYFTEDEANFIRDIDRRVRYLYIEKSYSPAINDLHIKLVNKYFKRYFINHIKDAEQKVSDYEKSIEKLSYSDEVRELQISHFKHSLINKYLDASDCEYGLLFSSYKVMMNVLNIREKFESSTFNIIAFKFKYDKEGQKKIKTLEEAREMFLELCEILRKEYCISYYDEFMLAELIEFNESATSNFVMPDAFKKNFMKTKIKYNIPDLKYDYFMLYRELKDFFIGITPFALYSIIEYHKLMDYQRPPILNYIDNNGTLVTNNKSDIMCFGDCFGIKPKQLSQIFKMEIKDCRNTAKRSKFYFTLKEINPKLYT